MRFTFTCPKCNSRDVLEIKGTSMNQQHKIPLTKWSLKSATLNRYICADCGYTEEYVQLNESFKKFAEKELKKQDRPTDDFV